MSSDGPCLATAARIWATENSMNPYMVDKPETRVTKSLQNERFCKMIFPPQPLLLSRGNHGNSDRVSVTMLYGSENSSSNTSGLGSHCRENCSSQSGFQCWWRAPPLLFIAMFSCGFCLGGAECQYSTESEKKSSDY